MGWERGITSVGRAVQKGGRGFEDFFLNLEWGSAGWERAMQVRGVAMQ